MERCSHLPACGICDHPGVIFNDNLKAVYCDVDDTLAMMNLSEWPNSPSVRVEYVRGPVMVAKNEKMINFINYLYKLGWDVYIWSKTGEGWARAVGKAFKLPFPVKAYLPKPAMILDDKEAKDWIGPKRYRLPNGEWKE